MSAQHASKVTFNTDGPIVKGLLTSLRNPPVNEQACLQPELQYATDAHFRSRDLEVSVGNYVNDAAVACYLGADHIHKPCQSRMATHTHDMPMSVLYCLQVL